MTDTTQAPAKPQREATSQRLWLDSDGKECEESVAVKGRYVITLAEHKGQFVEFEPKTNDAATRMAAIFGWHTRMGNDVNTWKHEKGDKTATPIEACQQTMELWASEPPVWAAKSEGGLKIDKDVLADAVVACIPTLEVTQVRAKLDDPEFFKTVRANADITAKYAALKGRQTSSLDDVLGLMGGATA